MRGLTIVLICLAAMFTLGWVAYDREETGEAHKLTAKCAKLQTAFDTEVAAGVEKQNLAAANLAKYQAAIKILRDVLPKNEDQIDGALKTAGIEVPAATVKAEIIDPVKEVRKGG